MKKKVFLCVAALALLAVGCSKQKTCRCSVIGESTVRIIKIEHGECEQLRTYNHPTMLDTLVVDSMLCMDYEFEIDSIYNK